MALSDVSGRLTNATPWRTCATCHALDGMSAEDATTLRELLTDRRVRFKDIADELRADPEAPSIDWQALSRHARGLCSARENLR